MVQKNNNKRQTSMTDDVFRIFRRTGRKITQIANQIEKERGMYLKESYSNKNALYKELASIPSVKEVSSDHRRRARTMSRMSSLPRFADVNTSDLICRPVKSQLSRQRQGQETELELEKRINVNVLKRCECCRRLAFRYKEMSEKMMIIEGQEEEEDKQKKESRETKSAKKEEKKNSEIQKLIDEASASPSRQDQKPGERNEQTRLFQYRKKSDVKIAVNQRVDTSFRSLTRQSQALHAQQSNTLANTRSLTTVPPPSPTKSEREGCQERSWSVLFDKCSFTAPPKPSPSPLGRQKIRVKFEQPHLKDKLKVSGRDWNNHLLKLQGKSGGEKQTVVALSKGYLAFKNLLRKMEDDRKREEEMAERSDSSAGSTCAPDSPIPRNRCQSDASITASMRWQPNAGRTSRIDSLIPFSQV
jgi:hypothetical protein